MEVFEKQIDVIDYLVQKQKNDVSYINNMSIHLYDKLYEIYIAIEQLIRFCMEKDHFVVDDIIDNLDTIRDELVEILNDNYT